MTCMVGEADGEGITVTASCRQTGVSGAADAVSLKTMYPSRLARPTLASTRRPVQEFTRRSRRTVREHWLFAIIGEDNVDVSKLCPSGNATVRNDVTFINGLIGVLIGIVYYPTTAEVFCDGPPPPG